MVEPISVNEALDRLQELGGQTITIFGVLSLDFEGACISHIPKHERRDKGDGAYQSSIWTYYDLQTMNINEATLMQLDGKHVVLSGTLKGPEAGFGGCGHFSLWPAEIIVTHVGKRERGA